jgi:hypothetical protein
MAEERRGQMRAIGAFLPRIAGPALGKNGLSEAQLIQHWTTIVGERLAQGTCPEKVTYPRGERRDGTLSLSVASGLALELQHSEPIILERINAFFGYRAVNRLALHQTLERRRPTAPARRALATADQAAIDQEVDAAIGDNELRAALKRLGTAIANSARK